METGSTRRNQNNSEVMGYDYSEPESQVCAAWVVGNQVRLDLRAFVTELKASKLVGNGIVFDGDAYVPVNHMGYFKAPSDAFDTNMHSNDVRSTKEWDYINASGVGTGLVLMALEVASTADGTKEEIRLQLKLADM